MGLNLGEAEMLPLLFFALTLNPLLTPLIIYIASEVEVIVLR